MDQVKDFICKNLQDEYAFPEGEDIDTLNYVQEGYVTSMGMIQFVVGLEEEFGIEFSEEELASEAFQIVGKLTEMVYKKLPCGS